MTPHRRRPSLRTTRSLLRRGLTVVARPVAARPATVLAAIETGDTERARSMLRLRPHDAESRYLRARIAEAEVLAAPAPQPTDWQPVVAQYRRALCVPSSVGSSLADEAERQLRLGGALERAGEQAAAADAYARAVGLGSADTPVPVEWRYRLARAEELAGRPDRSQARYREALDAEPDNPAFLYSMLEMTPKNFGARRQVARFVVDQADTIRARAETPSGDGARGLHRPVFVYWGQGYAAAPAVVRTCIHRFRSVVPAERLHLLTAETVPYYVTLSAPVRAMAETDPTHFADVLRAALLARYGGAWLDATCFAGPGFLDELDRLADAEYFAFRYEGPPKISNWFMTSVPGGYIARQIDAALRVYWESRRVKEHYFLYHYLFEALYWSDPEFRRRWDACPDRSTKPPHRLQFAMYASASERDVDALLARSFVHKLTWKVRRRRIDPGTVMAELMRRHRG